MAWSVARGGVERGVERGMGRGVERGVEGGGSELTPRHTEAV